MRDERAALAERLLSFAQRLARRARVRDEQSGLPSARRSALARLARSGPLSPGELARLEGVSAPTMSRLLAGLEAEGLILRRASDADARSRDVAVTSRGMARLDLATAARRAELVEALDAFAPSERSVLARALELLERL